MSAKQRFWFFVYSTPNIVGAAAALLGLAPHLLLEVFSERGGFNLWYVIVPGLYVLGYVASWSFQSPTASLKIRERQSAAEIRRELDDLVKQIRKRVAPEVLARVESIRGSTLDVLPQLTETGSSGNYDLYTVRQTALEYLPETLESYLNLPPTFARLHPLRDGKTAKQILLEQLTLIDDTLKEVVVNIHSQDANELLANQRFLNERLHKNEFAL